MNLYSYPRHVTTLGPNYDDKRVSFDEVAIVLILRVVHY